MGRVRTTGLLWITGVLVEVCLAGILALGDLREKMPLFFTLFGTASVLYLAATWRCKGAPLRLVVAFGLVFRVTLLFSTPSLSDDIYRYVWDGRVQAAGINPFQYAPASEALAHLRDPAVYPRINHPEIPTIYPPLAQGFFWGCYTLFPSVWTLKVGLVGFDLLTAWFLLGLLRVQGRDPGQLLVYLWNPLLVLEVAGNGHVDILGVSFVVMALLYLEVGGRGRAMGALGLSFLCKFYALCLVPVFWSWICAGGCRAGGWRGRMRAMANPRPAWPVLVFVGVALLGYLPYAGSGAALFAGLRTYVERWEFNALIFGFLRDALGSGAAARTAVGALFGCGVFALTLGGTCPLKAGYLLAGLFLLLTPTLHPWYLLWVLPFLVFYRHPGWLVFTGLAALSYHVLIRYASEGVWEEAPWVEGVEYGGFALVCTAYWVWRRFRRPASDPS